MLDANFVNDNNVSYVNIFIRFVVIHLNFFANIYMNDFDHYVKEKLRVKNYIKYMKHIFLLEEEI